METSTQWELFLGIVGTVLTLMTALIGIIWWQLCKQAEKTDERVNTTFDKIDEINKNLVNYHIELVSSFVSKADCEKSREECKQIRDIIAKHAS